MRCPRRTGTSLDDVRRFAAEMNGFGARVAAPGCGSAITTTRSNSRARGDDLWDALLPSRRGRRPRDRRLLGGRRRPGPGRAHPAPPAASKTLHMKDRGPGPAFADAPAGQGSLDFPAIVEAGRSAGVEWYIAEQDDAIIAASTTSRRPSGTWGRSPGDRGPPSRPARPSPGRLHVAPDVDGPHRQRGGLHAPVGSRPGARDVHHGQRHPRPGDRRRSDQPAVPAPRPDVPVGLVHRALRLVVDPAASRPRPGSRRHRGGRRGDRR